MPIKWFKIKEPLLQEAVYSKNKNGYLFITQCSNDFAFFKKTLDAFSG